MFFIPFMLTCSMMRSSLTFTAGTVCLCSRPWSVCKVLFVPYVDAVTVMHVLFVLHVCMLRKCEGIGNTGVRVWMVQVIQVLCQVQTT